ncbi:piggyBac transposable element-derived protein 3-like [Neoarius graeffei]|uniref:piggyBac transposable element-derived protein 3-like n=1 Tax=Neoarius graeffei TaxID=443677 RepID=UPI00298C952D|nr:piggyBac transposable element-derived protein 3-like [Neoarius graeffei]
MMQCQMYPVRTAMMNECILNFVLIPPRIFLMTMWRTSHRCQLGRKHGVRPNSIHFHGRQKVMQIPLYHHCGFFEPGVQLSTEDNHTPLDLFRLFISEDAVETLCRNTNKQAARNIARRAKYRWVDVGVAEFYRYLGLVFYMGMLKLGHITDYWRRNNIFSVPFPAEVVTRDRYRTIFWNVHMSDPNEDRGNDAKRGTSAHDKLFRVKPLMDTIQIACKAFYHPHRSLSVDDCMAPSRGHTMRQYMKDKPTKWDFKLFVLADSSNGYTLDFSVYKGKSNLPTGHGLSYDCHVAD